MVELNNVEQAVQAHQYTADDWKRPQGRILLLLPCCDPGAAPSCMPDGRAYRLRRYASAGRNSSREPAKLAQDNLDYRIPGGRDDEIGLLIGSFNRMAEDLTQNRRQRLEAEKIAALA